MANKRKSPNYGVSKIGGRLHFETKGFVPGSMGRGDVTGWARGVSKPFGSQFKPIRPECSERVQSFSQPITSLANVHPVAKPEPVNDGKEICLATAKGPRTVNLGDADLCEAKAADAARRRTSASDFFAKLYANASKRKRVKVLEFA